MCVFISYEGIFNNIIVLGVVVLVVVTVVIGILATCTRTELAPLSPRTLEPHPEGQVRAGATLKPKPNPRPNPNPNAPPSPPFGVEGLRPAY